MSRVRFPSPFYSNLASTLLNANGLESCAIAYAHHDARSDTWIVADASIVPEDAYEHRTCVSAVLKSSFLIEVANRSRVTGMAVISIHTHPASSDHPHFSPIDDAGETELDSYFVRQAAPMPHVSLVIGPHGCRARPLGKEDEIDVWEVGDRLLLHSPKRDGSDQERDDRQVRAFGAPRQRLLRRRHRKVNFSEAKA